MQQSVETAAARPAEVLLTGGTLADAAGMGPSQLEAIYGLAFQEMDQRHYDEAEKTLRALCLVSHTSARYWLALGVCRQRMGAFEAAVHAYSMAAEQGDLDPMVPLRAAECYLMLGMYDEAVSGIEAALETTHTAEDPQALVRHIELLVEALEKASGATPRNDPAPR
ncbi:MAG TPA: SycD/LcrH family type III secretion system chaperone [Geminicoccaceae bacterium]|nr:SycD/LcrH family type III secretion system chaperone [Geminicoccus sp.]HMU51949.1 SycD/LcrH family type III secretion system chaperone [Geminicoccaceae bacterium]